MHFIWGILIIAVLFVFAFFAQNYILHHFHNKFKYIIPIAFIAILIILFLTKVINLSTFIIFTTLGAIQLFGLERQQKQKQQHPDEPKNDDPEL